MKRIIAVMALCIVLCAGQALGAIQYLDNTLAGTCAGGAGTSYRISERDCGGSSGTKAYKTFAVALTSSNVAYGDTLYVRGGSWSEDGQVTTAIGAGFNASTALSPGRAGRTIEIQTKSLTHFYAPVEGLSTAPFTLKNNWNLRAGYTLKKYWSVSDGSRTILSR